MKLTGGRQRLWIGAWILATLFLGGLNGYWLMSLEQQPLVGYSQTIRTLQTQLVQFESMLNADVLSLNPGRDLQSLFNPSGKTGSPQGNRTVPPAAAVAPSRTADAIALPTLSGIMQVMGPHGSVYFQAVLNGRVCRQKDKIEAFTVGQITPDGVVLRRSGGKWFIESPSPFYSSDQGE